MIIDIIFWPYLFFTLSILYLLLLLLILIGLSRLNKSGNNQKLHKISVVIAARNESGRITSCLKSLEWLDYPQDLYEVIFVDDCSDDDTAKIISDFVDRHDHWKLIRLTEKSTTLRGKKNALLCGIDQAAGELICTTDADCRVPKTWLEGMNRYFANPVAMVLGYSPLKKTPGFINLFLRFDNLFSAIASAAPAKLGFPFTSVGRNMAYRKEAYDNAGGFLALKKFKSGDDIHLTERFRYLNSGRIEYCAHPDTFVETDPPENFDEIFHQQIRKNSKILLSTMPSIVLAIMIFIYYVLLVAIPLRSPEFLNTWLIFLIAKLVFEFIPLALANKIFQQKIKWAVIILFQFLYPVHIIGFSMLGLFQIYKWKK